MKKLLLFIGLIASIASFSQPITLMPTYAGDPNGAWVPIVLNNANRKIDASYLGYRKVDSIWFSNDTLYYTKRGLTYGKKMPVHTLQQILTAGNSTTVQPVFHAGVDLSGSNLENVGIGTIAELNSETVYASDIFATTEAGYTRNRSSSYTDRSFTDKRYVDSLYGLGGGGGYFIDAVPTAGSDNAAASGGVRNAIDSVKATINARSQDLNHAWYLRNNLKWVEYYQQKVDQQSDDYVFAVLGDSKIEMPNVRRNLIEALAMKASVKGQGYMPFGNVVTTLFNTVEVGSSASWTIKDYNTGGKNLAGYSLESKVGSVSIGWTANSSTTNDWNKFTDLKVGYFGKTGGGSFTIYIDGTSRGTINTSLTTGVKDTTILGLSDAGHSVSIQPNSINAELLYVSPYRHNDYVRGYLMHGIGHSGAMVDTYLSITDTASWNQQFRGLKVGMLSIYLGTNERHNNVAPSVYKANMKTLLRRFKAINRKMDIALWTQVDEDSTNAYFSSATHTAEEYNKVLREVASEDTVALFDIAKVAGPFAINNKMPWLDDGIHESDPGAYTEAQNFFNGIPAMSSMTNAPLAISKLTKGAVIIESNGNSGGLITTSGLTAAGITATTYVTTPSATIAGQEISAFAGDAFLQAGTTIDGGAYPGKGVSLLSSTQAAVPDNWYFGNVYEKYGMTGLLRGWNQPSNVMRISQGWSNPANASDRANFFAITGEINMPTASTTNTIGGFYYNPLVTSLGSASHRAIQTVSGNVLFGTTSGSVGVGANTTIAASAIIDVTSTTKGFLPPRMTTTQRTAISSPAEGLMVYDTDTHKSYTFDGTIWQAHW